MSAQECRNDYKTLLDEQRIIAERQRVPSEVISEYETASVTGIWYPTAREFSAALQRVRYIKLRHRVLLRLQEFISQQFIPQLEPERCRHCTDRRDETTLEMRRFPNPGTQSHRPWIVRYATPGAGTQRISDPQHLTAQALCLFDIITEAIRNPFLQSDCQIIRSCLWFKIPFFTVRSNSDQEMANLMSDENED